MDRRDFIKRSAAASFAASLNPQLSRASDQPIPRRTLGRTGEKVSMVGIGGYHIGGPSVEEKEGIAIIRAALDNEINFLDNCWDYNDGASEERMGKALRDGYRQKAFVMTKIDGRTGASARHQLEESLVRLKTDHIDLLQIHEVIRKGDPEQAFQPGYVMDVLKQARQEGKIRFIGFTGHKSPEIHLHMIETADKFGFTFDSVQMPVNPLTAHYNSFQQKIIPEAQKRGMAVLGMKPLANGAILKTNTVTAPEGLH